MSNEWPGDAPGRMVIVTASSLAARQWEAHLAAAQIRRGEAAWISPPIVTQQQWIERLWVSRQDRPPPLTPGQSQALWRTVIADSSEGAELIGTVGPADWAAAAWASLCDWRIDPRELRAAPDQPDFRAFLAWCRRYRAVLDAHGWVDHPELALRLPAEEVDAPATLILADLHDRPPGHEALLERLARQGCRIERWTAPPVAGNRHRARLADAAEELRAAAGWARRRLDERPTSRLALVVPGLDDRHAEIERALAAGWSGSRASEAPPVWLPGRPLRARPLLGAALTGVELVTPRATFATLSRWLRSPFFTVDEPVGRSARALLEAKLRTEVRAQLPFGHAYRNAGLAEALRRDAPEVAAVLAAAFAEAGTARLATPGRWARAWQRALTRLGWPSAATARDDPELLAWQGALDELVRLTPVLDAISAERAFDELERIAGRGSGAPPLPLAGVHVLAHLDEVGPGYDAAWVTGFTDSFWPERPHPNPLLPRIWQRDRGMPWATPRDARERSARSFARLLGRVGDLVFSWPSRVFDYETEPSPAITALPELPVTELREWLAGDSSARPRAGALRETVADAAPPLSESELRGGAGMLGRQARCPLRAFCQDRLAARPLEPVTFGLSARWQGVATHRALHLLTRDLPTQAELATAGGRVAGCVERALSEVFGGARHALRALFELERQRLTELLGALLVAEARRSAFTVIDVEQRVEVGILERTLRVRLDRVDRLADGRLAVIDYKTGERASSASWLRARLHDPQVPLYATHVGGDVGAAVIVRLGARDVSYTGIWPDGAFPGNAAKLPDERTWAEQVAVWRSQLERLVTELAAGDTRLFLAGLDEVGGAYAPLSRAAEQLALQRGLVPRW